MRIVNVEITKKSNSITRWPKDAEDYRFENNREAKSFFHNIHFNSGCNLTKTNKPIRIWLQY